MTPMEHYSERLGARESRLAGFDRLDGRIATARLLLAGAALVLAWLCVGRRSASALWLSLPAAAFAVLVVYHQRIRMHRGLAERSAAFYRAGIDRLRGQWRSRGRASERFVAEHHPYGADLDLFGAHSLYERLCAARTPMGEHVLAGWLLAPAPLQTIRERHLSVAELRERTDLREDLAVVGDLPHIVLPSDAIRQWADAPNALSGSGLRMAATTLAALACATAVIWAIWGYAFPFLLVVVAEAALNHALRDRVQRCVSGVEHAYQDLHLLAALLRRIEAEPFDSPPLRALQSALSSHTLAASTTLSKLATLVNFVEARRNPFLTPLLLPLMYTVQSAMAAERWRTRHRRAVGSWLDVLGEIEALTSIAGYSFERPEDPFPEFLEGPAAFRASGLGHPLIAAAARVRNDVNLGATTRVLLVSGSNMSGKSTLLRSAGVNTVLAMAGAPVCAARLELTPLQVGASIRVNDSLQEGSSRFYAEIIRLRQLFDPFPLPLLFLLDELLQGTNSNDRRIGAQGVVRALIARGAIGCISTHDLALTDGSELPDGVLQNVHFQDELVDGKLSFDFKLRDGVVTKSNGIELMRAIGLNV